MATPPGSPPHSNMPLEATSRKTRQSTRPRSLIVRGLDQPRPTVNVNPATGRGSSPEKEKFHSHLGVSAREKIHIIHSSWNDVPKSLKNLVWNDILGIQKKAQEIQKYNDCPHLLFRGDYDLLEKKLLDEKRKTGEQQAEFTENSSLSVDPPSPVSRHVKWKMANTKRYGQMTSTAAQEMSDKIVRLFRRTDDPGKLCFDGRHDILNMAIGRPEHLSRIRVAGTGVTISQYFGQTSRGSNSSCTSISEQQLAQIISNLREQLRKEVEEEKENKHSLELIKQKLKQAIKLLELSQIASQHLPPLEPPDIQVVVARVSTKGSCVDPDTIRSAKEPSDLHVDTMGLYIVHDQCTKLVALGKVYDSASAIHNVPYADDVVRVSVVKVYHGDAQVSFSTSEIQFVRQAVGTFVGGPTYLIKPVANEDSQIRMSKRVTSAGMDTTVPAVDPLGELVKNLFYVYQKPFELPWDGAKFGIPNVKDGFFITRTDDNIVVWLFSLRKKPDVNIKGAINSAMKTLTSSLEGKGDQARPRWIEPKSHVQTGGYECGYYVMHWMWCIVGGRLKNEWNTWFSDATPLDKDTMTTIHNKWLAYFLQIKNMEFRNM
ncbi:hypothetical protein GmHk_15G044997 [Glycine max]|nr:hypothetical protein GmHk_15G044997 [Glycine max]